MSGGRAGDLVEQALTALGKVVLWSLSVSGDDARLQREIVRITARFGAVPAEVSARILAADEAALVAWTARVLTAPTPEDVLVEDDERPAPAPRRPAARKRARRV
ncbi:hypothetical protein WMF04_20035 [Sorangium sp. So ce260]|uniref:hypothetical protein n=1 Tax=Sorangium sp. So ce260 TaxID=3133291 RepID=UPI003F5F8B0C